MYIICKNLSRLCADIWWIAAGLDAVAYTSDEWITLSPFVYLLNILKTNRHTDGLLNSLA